MLKQLDTLIGFAVVMSVISLLITVVTQMVSSLLGLRGKNLADALEAMWHKLDPQLNVQVANLSRKLADHVLTRPALSDSMLSMSARWPLLWKRASAIRPRELLVSLEHLSGQTQAPDGPPQTLEQAAARLLKILNTPTPATTEAISALKASLPDLAAQQGQALIAHFNSATNIALGNLEQRFNSAQDRARQWFGMHTRIITVTASALAAFLLQLDAFQLIQRLSSDPDARARLVSGAASLNLQAEQVLGEALSANPTLQSNTLAQLDAKYPGLSDTLGAPPPSPTLSDLQPWLAARLANTAWSNRSETIISDFRSAAQAASRARLDELSRQFGEIEGRFSKSGIMLIPNPYPSPASGTWSWPWPHLLGILASVALLSLGAPFWFNLLKSLANLRPALAQQIENDPKPSPARP